MRLGEFAQPLILRSFVLSMGDRPMKRELAILKMRETLVKRRGALRKTLGFQSEMLREGQGSSVGDSIDAAIDSERSEINSRLADVESRELASIDAALERIRDGQYGSCEDCGGNIPITRLRAVPYATLCIKCQREREKKEMEQTGSTGWSNIFDTNSDEIRLDNHEVGTL